MLKIEKEKLRLVMPTCKSASKTALKSNNNKKIRILLGGKGKLLSIVALSVGLSACSGNFELGRSEHFVQSGSALGISAQAEREIGLVNEGKTTQGVKSSHYELQEKKLSFLEKVMMNLKTQQTQQQGAK